jgi:hypothetical protein
MTGEVAAGNREYLKAMTAQFYKRRFALTIRMNSCRQGGCAGRANDAMMPMAPIGA